MKSTDIALQIEESLNKQKIDALVAQMQLAASSRVLVLLLRDFIGFPRVVDAVDAKLAEIDGAVVNG